MPAGSARAVLSEIVLVLLPFTVIDVTSGGWFGTECTEGQGRTFFSDSYSSIKELLIKQSVMSAELLITPDSTSFSVFQQRSRSTADNLDVSLMPVWLLFCLHHMIPFSDWLDVHLVRPVENESSIKVFVLTSASKTNVRQTKLFLFTFSLYCTIIPMLYTDM